MDEIKALKDKLKKKNATIKSLRRALESHKNFHYFYESMCIRLERRINICEKLLPIKYYKVTYEIWMNGKIEERGTELIKAHHPDLALDKLKNKITNCDVILKDILEVAS